MKKISLLAIVAGILLVAVSCTKQNDNPVTPTVTVKPLETLLTDSTWKLQEGRFLQTFTGDFTYYSRGLTGNGNIYDMDSIRFNADYSGKYTNSGGTSVFTWSLLDAQKTKLRIIFPVNGFTVNWENLNVGETFLRYTEYYTEPSSGLRSEGAFYRTPR